MDGKLARHLRCQHTCSLGIAVRCALLLPQEIYHTLSNGANLHACILVSVQQIIRPRSLGSMLLTHHVYGNGICNQSVCASAVLPQLTFIHFCRRFRPFSLMMACRSHVAQHRQRLQLCPIKFIDYLCWAGNRARMGPETLAAFQPHFTRLHRIFTQPAQTSQQPAHTKVSTDEM